MAKKKTVGPDTGAAPAESTSRRRATPTARRRPAAAPDPGVAEPGVTPPAEPLHLANDMPLDAVGPAASDGREPSHDEIAEAAYRRWLERGGNHGSDFDDWVEAERTLRSR